MIRQPMPGALARVRDLWTVRLGVFTDQIDFTGDPTIICVQDGKVVETGAYLFAQGFAIDCFGLPHAGLPPETAIVKAQALITSNDVAAFDVAERLAAKIYGFTGSPRLWEMGLFVVARTRESRWEWRRQQAQRLR